MVAQFELVYDVLEEVNVLSNAMVSITQFPVERGSGLHTSSLPSIVHCSLFKYWTVIMFADKVEASTTKGTPRSE